MLCHNPASFGLIILQDYRISELVVNTNRIQRKRSYRRDQALLDQVFAETAIEVTEEEIQSLYAGAGGAEAGLPPLEEVREQVVAQIRGGKEQEVVTTFLQTLKETATIEILV